MTIDKDARRPIRWTLGALRKLFPGVPFRSARPNEPQWQRTPMPETRFTPLRPGAAGLADITPPASEVAARIVEQHEMAVASAGTAVILTEAHGGAVDREALEPEVKDWLAKAEGKP